MTARKIAAKDADQYMLRLPPGIRNRVAKRAAKNGRSMNTEIVEAILDALNSPTILEHLDARLRRVEEMVKASVETNL
jgi:hypothetical protein